MDYYKENVMGSFLKRKCYGKQWSSVCWTHVNVMKIVITHSYNDEGAVIFFSRVRILAHLYWPVPSVRVYLAFSFSVLVNR